MSERTVQRVGAKIVVRSIDNAGCTMRALTVTSKLRLQGSALAAALARPDVQAALADVSWRTGAGHVTGVSVVYGKPEPELTRCGKPPPARWPRARWSGRAATAPSTRTSRSSCQRVRSARASTGRTSASTARPLTTRARRRCRPTGRRSDVRAGCPAGAAILRPPLSVDTVARIFELRAAGLSFKKIGKALGIAAWTVSRYVRSFEEGDR